MTNPSNKRQDRAKEELAGEANEDAEFEARSARYLRKWKRATMWLGGALLLSIALSVPFAYGYPLHAYWDSVGKTILVLSMILLLPFMYAAGMTFILWWSQRQTERMDRKMSMPGWDMSPEAQKLRSEPMKAHRASPPNRLRSAALFLLLFFILLVFFLATHGYLHR